MGRIFFSLMQKCVHYCVLRSFTIPYICYKFVIRFRSSSSKRLDPISGTFCVLLNSEHSTNYFTVHRFIQQLKWHCGSRRGSIPHPLSLTTGFTYMGRTCSLSTEFYTTLLDSGASVSAFLGDDDVKYLRKIYKC